MSVRDKCCLCSSGNLNKFAELDHRILSKCKNCHFVFASQYNRDEIVKGYIDYYPSANAPEIQNWIDNHSFTWQGLVQDINRYYRRKNIDNILDIGAGTGGFLEFFHLQYPDTELHAIESSPNAMENLKSRLPCLKFPLKSVEKISNLNNHYNVITLLQCLEHISEPFNLCRNIHRLLNNEGILLVTVPNRYSYKVLLRGFKDSYCYSNKTHLQFFSISTLNLILRKSGFKKIKRICRWGGSEIKGFKVPAQYFLRNMGLSTELRFIAEK